MLDNNLYLLQSSQTIFDKGVIPGHITPTKLNNNNNNSNMCLFDTFTFCQNARLFFAFSFLPPARAGEGKEREFIFFGLEDLQGPNPSFTSTLFFF